MLGIEQKKGDSHNLCGRLIVYAKISPSASKNDSGPIPFTSMVKNGILAVKGEFKNNDSLKRFMQHEMGSSMDKGISDLIEHIKEQGGELPEGVDADAFRDRLEELSSMEIIPVPAKIVFYESETEILNEDADIYYIGEFSGMSQAHLCITSLPIFYQAKFREQATLSEQKYINEILSQIETEDPVTTKVMGEFLPGKGNLNLFIGNLQELLDSRVIPYLLYRANDDAEFKTCITRFKDFMKPYPDQKDVLAIENSVSALRKNEHDSVERSRLELLCSKVSAMYHEKFELIPDIQKKLSLLGPSERQE